MQSVKVDEPKSSQFAQTPRVLMVSKPVAPPWNDSSKNLVRDLARSLGRYQPTIMTHSGVDLGFPGVHSRAVYGRAAGRYAPALQANARVLWHLLTGPRHDLWHFFFAPNRRSSNASAWASRARAMRSVQTVCSAPADVPDLASLLFADRVVVLSEHTRRRVLAAGVDAARVRCIPPAVEPLPLASANEVAAIRDAHRVASEGLLLVYPGDLEFSSGAECTLRAHARLRESFDCSLVLACRAKTAGARAHELRLRALCSALGVDSSTHWLGETPRIHALLAAADVVVLPADSLYAKMDLPLVLIEAMLLQSAVVTSSTTAAAELATDGAALAVTPTPDAVAAAIAPLFADAQLRHALALRAREVAMTRYHPARMASAYETVYDELYR